MFLLSSLKRVIAACYSKYYNTLNVIICPCCFKLLVMILEKHNKRDWEVCHHNSPTNPLTNENYRICNYKTTKTIARQRLVEPFPMYKPLDLLALISPAFALTGQAEGKAFYG